MGAGEAGYNLDTPCMLTLTPTASLETSIHLTLMPLDCWRKAKYPQGTRDENVQTPHRKAPAGLWSQTQDILTVRRKC